MPARRRSESVPADKQQAVAHAKVDQRIASRQGSHHRKRRGRIEQHHRYLMNAPVALVTREKTFYKTSLVTREVSWMTLLASSAL